MTFEQACEAYEAARFRDPRENPYGFVGGDAGVYAGGDALWFASLERMYDFIQTAEVVLHLIDPAQSPRIGAAVGEVLRGLPPCTTETISRLNVAFDEENEIYWMGTFSQLCNEGSPAGYRGRYREHRDAAGSEPPGEHDDPASPIREDEIEGFILYLQRIRELEN